MSVIKQWENQGLSDFKFSNSGVLRKPWLEQKKDEPSDPVETAKKIEEAVKGSVHKTDEPHQEREKYSWERPWPEGSQESE